MLKGFVCKIDLTNSIGKEMKGLHHWDLSKRQDNKTLAIGLNSYIIT
jgi:hypothetical protein